MGISRRELFMALGKVTEGPQINPHTHRAYVAYEDRVWREQLDDSPHGHPWHTSFHASSMPGGEKSCGRKAIYTLMDIPSAEPAPPRLRAQAEMGKAAESQIIFRWGQAGLLLAGSSPLTDGGPYRQIRLEDPSLWLSGSGDAILGIPDYPFILPVDIKSKSPDVINAMKIGKTGADPKNVAQVQAYIYLANRIYDEMGWREMGFGRPNGGVLYYVSRENPRETKEFFIEADWDYINEGVRLLGEWKEHFLAGTLPPRPKEWKWTEMPCKWCDFKKHACKPDDKAKVLNIVDSNAITFAKEIRPNYDLNDKVKEVLDRWQ